MVDHNAAGAGPRELEAMPIPPPAPWAMILGAVFGGLTLAGLFVFAFLAAKDASFVCNSFTLLAPIFALGAALSAGFLGGAAAAGGQFGDAAQTHTMKFSVGGGVAVLFIAFVAFQYFKPTTTECLPQRFIQSSLTYKIPPAGAAAASSDLAFKFAVQPRKGATREASVYSLRFRPFRQAPAVRCGRRGHPDRRAKPPAVQEVQRGRRERAVFPQGRIHHHVPHLFRKGFRAGEERALARAENRFRVHRPRPHPAAARPADDPESHEYRRQARARQRQPQSGHLPLGDRAQRPGALFHQDRGRRVSGARRGLSVLAGRGRARGRRSGHEPAVRDPGRLGQIPRRQGAVAAGRKARSSRHQGALPGQGRAIDPVGAEQRPNRDQYLRRPEDGLDQHDQAAGQCPGESASAHACLEREPAPGRTPLSRRCEHRERVRSST